ncbi:MAG: carbon storage regulator [Syntrophobacteraceae bacterium]
MHRYYAERQKNADTDQKDWRIDSDIQVVITSIDQNRVRVGIKSPKHIPIYREELYRKIQEENRSAASIGKDELDGMLEKYTGIPASDPFDRDKP